MGKLNVKLKMLMFERRMSNQELAQKVGVSRTTISLIINGGTVPNLTTAQRIARELGTTTDDLFPLEGRKNGG